MIALYVHPKNSNHLRSHLRAIMALDHSRLGLENKFLENKSGRIFCVRQVYKFLPINLGACKPIFYFFYTPHLRRKSTMRRCFYHTDLVQNAVVHNFSRQIAFIQFRTNFQNHLYGQPVLTFDKRQYANLQRNFKRVTRPHDKGFIVFIFY